jgi:hypothetical protein
MIETRLHKAHVTHTWWKLRSPTVADYGHTHNFVMSIARHIISWERDIMSWERDIMSWERDIMSWERDIMSWKRDIMSWKRDISRGNEIQKLFWMSP